MFKITITASVVMTLMTFLVLAALEINKDKGEVIKYIKKALWVNLSALFVVDITFYVCYLYCPVADPISVELLHGTAWYNILKLSDLALTPISICFVKYIGALVYHKPKIDKKINHFVNIMTWLGIMQCCLVTAYIFMKLMGIESILHDYVVDIVEIVTVLLFMLLITVIIYEVRKELGKIRLLCCSLYIIGQLASLHVIILHDDSFFYSVGAGIYIFLLLAMQTERIDVGNAESVQKALVKAEELNAQLEISLGEVEREKFLLSELADVFISLHLINVRKDSFREIGSCPRKISRILQDSNGNVSIQKLIWKIMKTVNNQAFQEDALIFTDFSTLNARMNGRKSISFESIDDDDRWIRYSFIRVGNDRNANIEEVLFTSQDIDHERRETERLRRVSYVDELTGVNNRNAYIDHCKQYRKNDIDQNLWIIVTDINGLKLTNDTKGHRAGDELIKATAECLDKTFGNYGHIFRNGGDEFVTIIKTDRVTFYRMIQEVNIMRKEWKGMYNDYLLFSKGFVRSGDFPDLNIEDLVKEADKRMYEEKRKFYSTYTEYDRRMITR